MSGSQPRSKFPLPNLPPAAGAKDGDKFANAAQQRMLARFNRPKRTEVAPTERSMAALMKVPTSSIKISQKGTMGITHASARELIAEHTKAGEDIVRFMLNAMNGQVDGVKGRARIAAAEWLGLYLFGKPVETTLQLSMKQKDGTLPSISDDELEQLARGLVSGVPPPTPHELSDETDVVPVAELPEGEK